MLTRTIKTVSIAGTILILTACGGGGSTPSEQNSNPTAEEIAIDKISAYAQNGESLPTVQDYLDAGVTGVNTSNIDDLNTAVEALEENDVDTSGEIQAVLDELNIALPADVTPPTISLVGESEMTLVQGSIYSDPGVNVNDDRDSEANIDVQKSGTVDTSIVGDYTVTYTAVDQAGNSASIARVIHVVEAPDTEKPVVTLNGTSTVTLVQGTPYTEQGATVSDNKDVTLNVTISGEVDTTTVGEYTVTYSATDSEGNTGSAVRVVTVVLPPDTTAPVISLIGDNPMILIQGETFTDPGVSATDDRDENVDIVSSGEVDTATIGEYTLTYSATDSAGNEANVTRAVRVTEDTVVHNVSNVTEFRQALEDAAANNSSDTIVLQAGVYNTTSDGLGAFSFIDNEEYNLTLRTADGLSTKDVVLDGNDSTRVLYFSNTQQSTLTLKGITVTKGLSDVAAGVFCNLDLYLEDCNISYNKADSTGSVDVNGGGFYASGKLTKIVNTTISYNNNQGYGGGFYSDAKQITIQNSQIVHNQSAKNGGGFFSYTSDVHIKDSNFSNNFTKDKYSNGGGFLSLGGRVTSPNGLEIHIEDSNFSNNYSNGTYSSGGGFYIDTVQNVLLDKTIISNNQSSKNGGGFYLGGCDAAMSNISHCTISNNKSITGNGAGFYLANTSATIDSTFITDNEALYAGGGFYSEIEINHEKIMVVNTVFNANKATSGGSFYSGYAYTGTVRVYASNNNFSNNTSSVYANGVFVNNVFTDNAEDITLDDSVQSHIYNNYIDYSKIIGSNTIKKNNLQPSVVGEVTFSDDNITPDAGSPLIDAGLNPSSSTYGEIIADNAVYETIKTLLIKDIKENQRVHNTTIDIGVTEYGSNP